MARGGKRPGAGRPYKEKGIVRIGSGRSGGVSVEVKADVIQAAAADPSVSAAIERAIHNVVFKLEPCWTCADRRTRLRNLLGAPQCAKCKREEAG